MMHAPLDEHRQLLCVCARRLGRGASHAEQPEARFLRREVRATTHGTHLDGGHRARDVQVAPALARRPWPSLAQTRTLSLINNNM